MAEFSTHLTADAVDLMDGRFLFRLVRGLGEVPTVRGEDTIIPSATGRTARSRVADTLRLEAQGWVLGEGVGEAAQRADFRDAVDELRALMDPTQDPYTIEVEVEDGSTRTILARPLNIVWGEDRIPSMCYASLEWESVAPTWTAGGS